MRLRDRLKHVVQEYGPIALLVYFAIFFLVFGAFYIAISRGVDLDHVFGESASGVMQRAGLLGATYLATKLTQPLRIAATLVLTPFVAKLLRYGKSRRD